MKTIPQVLTLAFVALGMSSCCSMFGIQKENGYYETKTVRVKAAGYDVVTEEVHTPGPKGGMVQLVEKKVPRTKMITKKRWRSGGSCVRFYCPGDDACGTTSEKTMQLATAQGGVGSPHIGLMPTMKPLAE